MKKGIWALIILTLLCGGNIYAQNKDGINETVSSGNSDALIYPSPDTTAEVPLEETDSTDSVNAVNSTDPSDVSPDNNKPADSKTDKGKPPKSDDPSNKPPVDGEPAVSSMSAGDSFNEALSAWAVKPVQVTPSGNSGAAVTSIPIIVPPGRKGIQPNLSLNYNSNNRNG